MINNKIVLFLGAGFSAPAGFPTMKSFIDYFTDCPNRYPWDRSDPLPFDMPIKAYIGLEAAWYHAHKSIPVIPPNNLESVFCLIDFHAAIKPYWKIACRDEGGEFFSAENGRRVACVRKRFVHAIWYVTNHELRWESEEIRVAYINAFEKLIKTDLSVVTINYDRVPQTILREMSTDSYYLSTGDQEQGVPICALHGSVDWFKCEENNDKHKPIIMRDRELIPETLEPFIVPPTWHKGTLNDVWGKAASKIADSHKVFIIGLGLAETDIHLRYFLSTALGAAYSGNGQRDVIVINPDREAFCKICTLIRNANTAKGNDIRMAGWYKNIAEALKKGAFSG